MYLHWEEIQSFDIIVAVTSFISEEVRALGFRGEVIDLEVQAKILGIGVVDPQLMPRRQCAFELAKYLKVCVSSFELIGLIKTSPSFVAFMPETEASIEKALSMALAQVKVGSSVLLGDLIAPLNPIASASCTSLGTFKVDEKTISVELLGSPKGPGIFLPKSTVMHPAKVYLSKSWHDFMLKIATDSLVIVTPPQKNSNGKLAESYLSALYADKIRVVPS